MRVYRNKDSLICIYVRHLHFTVYTLKSKMHIHKERLSKIGTILSHNFSIQNVPSTRNKWKALTKGNQDTFSFLQDFKDHKSHRRENLPGVLCIFLGRKIMVGVWKGALNQAICQRFLVPCLAVHVWQWLQRSQWEYGASEVVERLRTTALEYFFIDIRIACCAWFVMVTKHLSLYISVKFNYINIVVIIIS